MTITKTAKQKHLLVAVTEKHKIKGFEDSKNEHEIFNSSLNDYHIVLKEDLNADELFRTISKFIAAQKKHAFDVDGNSFLKIVKKEFAHTLITVLVNAIEYGSVVPWSLKTDSKPLPNHSLVLSDAEHIKFAEERLVVAQAQTQARRLQDMPSNLMQPGVFEKEIKEIFKSLKNVKIKVLDRNELTKKGMNLLVGVGQAANQDVDQPRLVIIEYMGDSQNKTDTTAFVGKGVCFDTGGLNIKPGPHMRWMKYDMSGAAISAMAVYAMAKNNVKVNAYAVCPLVLNLAGSNGQRPDDVLVSYSGKTVEIDNTDAEGRLILADALTYAAKDLKVSRMLDIATLTGAMMYALGDTYTGVWTTTDCLWEKIEKSANDVGELVWRLPFHHDFKDLLKSNYADIANSVSDPRGGSSRAASFLKEFTLDVPFGHFDIAATGDRGHTGTGAILNTFYNFAKIAHEACSATSPKKAVKK